LSFLPGLARRSAVRAQIEAVRVAAGARARARGGDDRVGHRRGPAAEVHPRAADHGQGPGDAHRFYEGLGFVASHEGLPLQLPDPPRLTE